MFNTWSRGSHINAFQGSFKYVQDNAIGTIPDSMYILQEYKNW
jgi:hypothetical protein